MTEDIESMCGNASYKIPHIVVNMKMVEIIDEQAAEKFSQIQKQFYEQNKSMVICELQKEVKKVFVKLELIDFMNITPTESEAWDILQMEEIERELLNDFYAEDK